MTKEEILKEFDAICDYSVLHDENILLLRKLLDRYFLAMLEQSLPEKQIDPERADERELEERAYREGFNSCRSQVLENALRIVGGGEQSEKG